MPFSYSSRIDGRAWNDRESSIRNRARRPVRREAGREVIPKQMLANRGCSDSNSLADCVGDEIRELKDLAIEWMPIWVDPHGTIE